MSLLGMLLVRNEADRWLSQVLLGMKWACDKIVVMDDASTDATAQICINSGATVVQASESLWGINELKRRQQLWTLAEMVAKDGDWFLCLDADETIQDIWKLPEKIKLADQYGADGLSFNLYDMWDETHYRDDELWNAHTRDWVMCVKYDANRKYIWRDTPLHCGRFPLNAWMTVGQTGLAIQHWGWSRPEDREAKYRRYMEADPEGKNGSLAQYKSILDPNPNLKEFIL